MAYSRIVYPGDGVTTQFAVNFPLGYLSKTDVTLRVGSEVDGLGDPVYRTLTWINDGLVDIVGTGPVPAIGQDVVLQRTTSKTTVQHDFSDGAAMIAQNFDENQLQALMVAQEALDGRFGTLQANLDLGGFKAINSADPANPQDLATKAYVDQVAVLPSGNVPPPTLGNVGMFLKATATGVWAWTMIQVTDVVGAAKASLAQVLAATVDTYLVTPLTLGALWKYSGTAVASAATLALPANADRARMYRLTNSISVTALWAGATGETAVFRIINGVTFIHGANLSLKAAGANIATVAGDIIEFTCLGGSTWEHTGGQKADGTSWVAPVIDNELANRFEYFYMGGY